MITSNFLIRSSKSFIALLTFFLLVNYSFAQDATGEKKEKPKGVNIIITQSPKIIVKVEEVTHNVCFGESKGAINISASGGYPPYKYYWAHGDTTQDVAALKAGLYRVAVSDEFSCSDTVEIEIKQPEALTASIESVKDILCYGYNNGEVDISVTGGKAPYSYSWNNGATTQDLDGVNSGRYSVLITDANFCQEIATVDVEEKPLIVRSLDDVQNIKCNGDSTGSVDITVSGGVPPYTYSWNNGSISEDLKGVNAGIYEVVVKDSEGCTEVSSTKVHEPAALSVSIDEIRDLRCNGDLGGAININVIGGKAPYKYQWNSGATTQDIAGIPAGDYHVEVADNNGCQNSLSAQIEQPSSLNVVLQESKNISFNGGSDGAIDIEVSGGIPPYKYKWNNGNEAQDVNGLPAGGYSVRVTDGSGCAKIMNIALTQPSPLVVRVDETKDISCNGDSSGEINISVLGGVAPYTYQWSNNQTTQDIYNVPAGTYSVLVKDANGHSQTVEATLSEPPAFTAKVIETENILCNGNYTGSINLEVKGGVLPYKYRWSNGQATEDLVNIPAGSYSVKVTDANFCEQTASTTVTEPSPLRLSFDEVVNIKCYGDSTGSINLTVTGGEAPYTYKWTNGKSTEDLTNLVAGEYTVLVTDKNGCSEELAATIQQPEPLLLTEDLVKNIDCKGNASGSISLQTTGGVKPYQYTWNTGATTQNVFNISAGTYTLNVKDANGCSNTFTREITEPEKLVRSLESVTNNLCFGDAKGAVNINVSGGVEPYAYKWSNGAYTQDIVNVKAGEYSVSIKDANGCIDSLKATVTENPLLSASVNITDIKCYGLKSGAADLDVTGGVAPYTYQWSNEAKTQDISEVSAGNYSVLVKDAKGCQVTADAQISEPPRFVASLESDTDILCNSENTGQVMVRVNGGVQPYTFNWNNGATTQNLIDVPAGSYVLNAVDANGCKQTVSTTLTQPTKIEYSVKAITNVLCYGERGGAIDITVSGGVGPYKYQWNNNQTSQDLDGLVAGKYSVKISDANQCVKTLDAEVTQPDLLKLKLDTIQHILCFGEEKGAIDLNVQGGVKPYKYSWSNGATTQDISSLPAGIYSVTVTDAQGCSNTISATVNQPPLLTARVNSVKNIECYGERTGAISIDIIGGVKPYNIKWSNGETSQNLVDVGAGEYSVKITDNNGCVQVLNAVISQPSKLTASIASTQDVSCFEGNNGFINITVTGGSTPYKYSWNNGAESQDLFGITAGNYSLKIVDAKGCKDSSIVAQIKEPPLLTAKVKSVKNIQQYGQKTGAIDIEITGGVAPYQYSWSNGATTQDISNVPGGDYSTNIKDANGCEVRVNASIIQPPPLSVKLASIADIKCNGNNAGSIKINVSGGVSPYKFNWNNGATTQNLENVSAGDYTVTVTDANGYEQSLSAKIAQPSPLVITTDDQKNLACFEDNTGSVSVTVTGGKAPYKYAWNSGQTTQDISGLTAGDYSLTVTDAYGCTSVLNTEITQPDKFNVTIANVEHIKCFDQSEGKISLDVQGGTLPYSFYWNNGERSKDLTNVKAGQYNVKVNDANGCSNSLSVKLEQPTQLVSKIESVTNNLCYGENKGLVSVNVTGGSAPYNFVWSNGDSTKNLLNATKGDYSVKITDKNGCTNTLNTSVSEPPVLFVSLIDVTDVSCFGDKSGSISVEVKGGAGSYSYQWNNGMKEKNIKNIQAGDYQLTVKDVNGCVKTIEAEISQPELLTVKLDSINQVLCFGDNKGFIDINVAGGVFPYHYTWSNGSESEDLVNAMAGSYSVKVKDANGCLETLSASISQPGKLSVTLDSIVNNTCAGQNEGLVKVKAHGGVGPYSYLWNTGSRSEAISNVAAGKYTATVTDKNGCNATFETEVNEPDKLVKTIDAITDIRCNGDSTGAIQVTVQEGVAPYSFSWSNGATTEDIRGIKAGNYKLTITEANGCKSVLEANIEEPPAFYASIDDVQNIDCFGQMTGKIDVSAGGGVEPYSFSWSNGKTTEDLTDIGADSYSVMVTDDNGCLRTLNAEITEPSLLTMRIDSVHNVKCCGDNSGAIYISVDGGVKPYNYEWSNGANTEDIENLVLGVYTVVVTDAKGCIVTTPDDMTLYEQVVSKGKFTTRDINFDIGKSIIRPESFTTINKIATFMKEHPDISFRIDGHTDSDGSAESNQKLSEDRARSIRLALIKFGIRENRLETKGFGESSPLVPNTTAENKALNRRVEFIALTGTFEGTKIGNEIVEERQQ